MSQKIIVALAIHPSTRSHSLKMTRHVYRRIPPYQFEAVTGHIRQLSEEHVIREVCGPYGSSLILVQKKDGSLRMCVNYSQLNAKTRKEDACPLSVIDALIGCSNRCLPSGSLL